MPDSERISRRDDDERKPEPPPVADSQPAAPLAADPSPASVLALQRSAGNAAVQQLLSRRAAGPPTLMRFDAGSGGHQGMEREAAGLDPKGGLGRPDNLSRPEGAPGTREAGVNAVYAGNFMQDFSQLKVPSFHAMLSSVPKDPLGAPRGATVGAKGGEAIADSLIRALAILEVGPRLANDVVAANPQSYRPEQHVDQPMGYSPAVDTLVREQDPRSAHKGELRPGRRTVEGGRIGVAVETIDAARDRDLKGSAVPGIQMENPELLKVSDSGLQNHIYNSSEWVKNNWLKAVSLGPTDQGRFHVGSGLHAIEDYFAHSNFIEVGLNGYIDRAMKPTGKGARPSKGVQQFLDTVKADERAHASPSLQMAPGTKKPTHVDTMFDAPVRVPPGGKEPQRQAVTSGSVGTNDLKSSIGHILLPRIPDLQQAIDNGIDKMFGLVADDGVSSWDQITKLLGNDRPTAAFMAVGDGLQAAGITLPVPDDVELEWSSIDIPFLPDPDYPSGVSVIYEDVPIKSAIGTYVGFVKTVKNTIDTVREVLDWLRYLGPAAYAAVTAIKKLLSMLQDLIKEELTKLRESVKREFRLLLIRLLDEISGVNVIDEKNRTVGDALHDAEDRVHEFEQRTSLEARLLDKDDLGKLSKDEVEASVGPVEAAEGGGWKATGPLAPSHSEIAKDHAPPEEELHMHPRGGIWDAIGDTIHEIYDDDPAPLDEKKKAGDDHEHDHAAGSVFYGLARALALEADRHVLHQVELVWADRGSLYGDAVAMDTKGMQVDHDAFTGEAKTRADAEAKRAKGQGFTHAQSAEGNQAELAKRPAARDLLNLVDLIISHPEDSMWWRPIFDTYIGAHPDEVARHIRQRNRVRGDRTRVPS